MAFNPPYLSLEEREPWSNVYYNTVVAAALAAFAALDGVNLTAPVVLSKTGQDLDGDGHYLYNFKRWFGQGTDVSMRESGGFGDTGGGAVDDVDALQAAIDDLPSSGGCVLVSPGTHLIGARTLRLAGSDLSLARNNVTLRGCGPATILKLADNSDRDLLAFGQGTSGMVLEDLAIDGNLSNQTLEVANIDASGTTNCTIRNVWSTYAKGAGIKAGASDNLHVRNCLLLGNKNGLEHGLLRPATGMILSDLYSISNTSEGFALGPIDGLTAVSLVALSNGRRGLMILSSSAGGASTFTLADCAAISNGEDGFHLEAAVNNAALSDFVLSGCQAALNAGHGILLLGIVSAPVRGFTLSGCQARNNGVDGIKLAQQVSDGSIDGCISTHNSGRGIYLEGAGSTPSIEHVAIGGNIAYDAGTATQTHGIHLSALTRNCVVLANSVHGNTTAQILDEGVDNDVSHNP